MMMQDSNEQKFSLEDMQRALTGAKDLNQNLSEIEIKAQSITGLAGDIKNAFAQAFSPSQIMGLSQQFDKLSAQRAQLLGITKVEGENIKESIATSYSQLSRFGITMNQIRDAQFDFTKEYKTIALIPEEQLNSLMLTAKVSGVETSKLIGNFRDAGKNITHMSGEMKGVIDYARSIGVSVQAVSEKVAENIGKLNLYNFEGGVQGLSKMAAQATMLNIDMGKTFDLAEKLLSPEAAIELSSSLQMLGVTSSDLLDPLRAMDLAQNDPEELQKQLVELSRQFVITKEDGSFAIMPGAQRELRAISEKFGMTAKEFSEMGLKAEEMDKKMSEITFPEFEADEDAKQLIANMATLNKDNKYEVELIKEDKDTGEITKEKKLVSELKKDDLEFLKPQPVDSLEDLALKQVDELTAIKNAVQSMANAPTTAMAASGFFTNIQKGLATKISDAIKPEEITKLFEGAFEQMSKTARSAEGGEIAAGKADAEQMKDYMVEATKNIIITYGKELKQMFNAAGDAVLPDDFFEKVTTKLNSLITEIPGFQGGIPQTLTGVVEGGASAAQNFNITTSFNTLVDKLTKLTEKLDRIFPNSLLEANDFILTKDQMYQYNENDLIIGGTGLLGDMQKNLTPDDTKKVVTGESKFSEPKETIISPQITIKSDEDKKLTELISTLSEKPETGNEELTSVMMRYYELTKQLKSESINQSIEPNSIEGSKTIDVKPQLDLKELKNNIELDVIPNFNKTDFEKLKMEYIQQIEELNKMISEPIVPKETTTIKPNIDLTELQEESLDVLKGLEKINTLASEPIKPIEIETPKQFDVEEFEKQKELYITQINEINELISEPATFSPFNKTDDQVAKLLEFKTKLEDIIKSPLILGNIEKSETFDKTISDIKNELNSISIEPIKITDVDNTKFLKEKFNKEYKNTDPLLAMDLSQNDPEELQKQLVELSRQFVITKEDGSFEIMPGMEKHLSEITKMLGLTSEEFIRVGQEVVETNKKVSNFKDEKQKTFETPLVMKEPIIEKRDTDDYEQYLKKIKSILESISTTNITLGELVPNKNNEKTISELKEHLKSNLEEPITFKTESNVDVKKITDKGVEPENFDIRKSSLSEAMRKLSEKREITDIDSMNVNNLKISDTISSTLFKMPDIKPIESKVTVEPFKYEPKKENIETTEKKSDVNHNFGKLDINLVIDIPGLKDDMTTQNIAKSAVYEMFASGQFQRSFGDQLVMASKRASTSQGVNSVDVVV